jgi:3-isopropylmalate/(R)-2-methylmalate dehydratase large subunit
VFGTIDQCRHRPGRTDRTRFKGGDEFIRSFRDLARRAGIRLFDLDDPRQGIVRDLARAGSRCRLHARVPR